MSGIVERSVKNAIAVVILGQIPPFTFLPEEALTIPVAIGLGVVGFDIEKALGKVIK
jgi:hypothetical protein